MVVTGSSCRRPIDLQSIRARRRAALLASACLAALVCSLSPLTASAQTWADERARPSLFEVIAVDATGSSGWPFGREDVAGDGAATYEDDESAADLRSVYAVVRGDALWLRAYVQSAREPDPKVSAYFFIDADARTSTGGAARDAAHFTPFEADPSLGGYEHAVLVNGDGSSGGAFSWDASRKAWAPQSSDPSTPAAGVGRDPIRLAGDDHAFFQVQLPTERFDVELGCDSNIFVRIARVDEEDAERSFVDQDVTVQCRARLNVFGDPELLQSDVCSEDSTCPARGRCLDGTCVFGYACDADADCSEGRTCAGGVCVLRVDEACTSSSQCDGLVCSAGRCRACSDDGARGCEDDEVCTPAGACIRPSDAEGGGGEGGRGASGSGAAGSGAAGEQVRGGAFTCSAALPGAGGVTALGGGALGGLAFGAAWFGWLVRRKRSARRARKGGES